MMLTTDSHFIRAVLRHAQALGIDSEELLGKVGISYDMIMQDGNEARVPADQYAQLVRSIWEISGDETFGMTKVRCKAGHFELMVRYVIQFETLEVLMKEVCRFYRTVREDFYFKLDFEDDRVGFLVVLSDPDLDVDHYLTELMLVTMHRFFCWITGKRIPLLESRFSFSKPVYAEAYEELFPGVCSFDRDGDGDGFYFDKSWLKQGITRDWKDSQSLLANSPIGFIDIPGNDDSMIATLKGIMLTEHKKGNGFPDLSSVARVLSVTEQTIRRRLIKESSNYQQIKADIRRDIAIDKLTHSELSVSDIGFQLGFVEPSSFTRAFQQWTGASPSEYRSQLRNSSPGPQDGSR